MFDPHRILPQALSALLLVVVTAMPLTGTAEQKKLINTGPDKVAIKGYDVVAYFTDATPTKGKSELAVSWNDAKWYFATAEHRDLFLEDPEHYTPQFGGYCSMALAVGKIKDVNPEVWTIIDGKLYLSFSEVFLDKFSKDAAENIPKAEKNWADLRKQN